VNPPPCSSCLRARAVCVRSSYLLALVYVLDEYVVGS
jgi:hypothetical protein